MENKITNQLIKEIAKRDYIALTNIIKNRSYGEAYKKLDGFNLSAEPSTINGEVYGIVEFFDFQYGCLYGTIFRVPNNKCELYTTFEIRIMNCPLEKTLVEFQHDGQIKVRRLKYINKDNFIWCEE